MKISDLNNKDFLNETNAMSQSDVIINYKKEGMTDAITYKTNLEILGKSIANHLNLLSYNNGAIQTYTTTGTTYGTTTVDIDGKADKVSNVTAAGNFAGLDSSGNLVDSGHKHSDYLVANLKGANSGLAELDANGKIPITQLPLGDTSSTVYRGDYGAAAYTHAVTNKGSAYVSGLYKITTNSEGHVTSAAAVEKSDITALGIPGDISGKTDKVTSATNGNFAALDANGNLTDSGHKHSDYVTISQGVANAGKFLMINSSGNIEAVSISMWEGGNY